MILYMMIQLLVAAMLLFGDLTLREALRQLHVDAVENTPAFFNFCPERANLQDLMLWRPSVAAISVRRGSQHSLFLGDGGEGDWSSWWGRVCGAGSCPRGLRSCCGHDPREEDGRPGPFDDRWVEHSCYGEPSAH